MRKPALTLIGGGLIAAAAIGATSPASADTGGSGYSGYVIPDPGPVNQTPDARFYWLLTEPNQEHPMVIWNFPLVKAQALQGCQAQSNGLSSLETVYAIQNTFGYSFGDANSIHSAADVIYCRWNLSPRDGTVA
jgi:hypothetical protein